MMAFLQFDARREFNLFDWAESIADACLDLKRRCLERAVYASEAVAAF